MHAILRMCRMQFYACVILDANIRNEKTQHIQSECTLTHTAGSLEGDTDITDMEGMFWFPTALSVMSSQPSVCVLIVRRTSGFIIHDYSRTIEMDSSSVL